MDGRHDPPCRTASRMSLTNQQNSAAQTVEAEGELYDPLTGVMAVAGLMTEDLLP